MPGTSIEDKKRMKRRVTLSVYDLERLVGLVKDRKYISFKSGIEEEVNILQNLSDRLQKAIEKEKPQ